ncbi:hypothetical protein RRG08_020071 [Elysia crispata]|uniref:Uncharacterized protein n=1 Tax=Elysia crispata TaxID=231223 RepID=A0AAE1DKU0_9GAST|nr:hypothetical protein RRG08_020071 [Elysia crispata]
MSTVPKSSRVVAKTGTRSVGRVMSAERGTLVTLVCAINAIGNSVPPMFIFPRRTTGTILSGGPHGSIGKTMDPVGSKRKFGRAMWNISSNSQDPHKDSPILLILDNHVYCPYQPSTCAMNITSPSVTSTTLLTHKLQGLDRVVYGR